MGAKAGMKYYVDKKMDVVVSKKSEIIREFLQNQIQNIDHRLVIRGIGMIWGIDFEKIDYTLAGKVSKMCFERGLVIEVAGRKDAVLKILPPLTIEEEKLMKGLNIIKEAIECLKDSDTFK